MAESTEDERRQPWQERWSEGKIGFHLSAIHQDLERFYEKLVPDDRSRTVLVPLCGKSLDVVWLYEKGLTVIGIEIVEKAILDLFAENKLEFIVTSLSEATLYQTADGRLRVYRADICRLSSETIGPVDSIWDRASYVAVNVEDRPKYAAFLRSVMAPGCRYLLSTIEYAPCGYPGPPHSVTLEDFRPEFESTMDIERVSSRVLSLDNMARGLAKCNPQEVQENLYLLTLR